MTTPTKNMNDFWRDSYLASGNEDYLETLYETYLANPSDVSQEWRDYFNNMLQNSQSSVPDVSHAVIREQFLKYAKESTRAASKSFDSAQDQCQERVIEMISAFRRYGHLQANIDPLGLYQGQYSPNLELSYYGFTNQDHSREFHTGSFTSLNKTSATLSEIYKSLRNTYCGSIGFEYRHINRSEEVEWIRERIENGMSRFKITPDEKRRILDRLVVADGLEKYLGFKYVGQKRFSLEGGDALVPLLDTIVRRGAQHSVKEFVIGMAHRGRLNVLINIVGKPPKEIFSAFEGKGISSTHSGDVKYHLGCSSNVTTPNGPVHLALAFNPSHLEIVSPVVQGSVRARQRRRRNTDQQQAVPIQIHGDAAFAGQGVVMETFNMSQARWFTVGGSIHIVVNNQVGFTISNPKDARSTTYCTDIAKMIEAPILHVNANDPEAVYFAALFAIDYRHTFKRDMVIDLVCYRRHGHNEVDEPSATQPLMYKIIKSMQPAYLLYAKQLINEGLIDDEAVKKMVDDYRNALDDGRPVVDTIDHLSYQFTVNWDPFVGKSWTEPAKTAVPLKRIKEIGNQLETLPQGFVVQPQVKRTLELQKKMTEGSQPITWGYAEIMAYATLLDEGFPIRICGQDVARGTFAHRHAVLHDQNTDEIYIPLSHISPEQAQINIVDSLLSEEAVLAFEYGYATAEPNYLVIWEAQFGDFANGAQVVIDQFISSGEQKWGRLCGLVMLLPHGYEGQGPEHSSARLERYLQLCAQENMQVCTPTTPSQIFHLLRRQIIRKCRKPLIVMSPKSVLRNPLATSSLNELSDSEFKLILPDIDVLDSKKVERIVFCSGKVFYDLYEKRRAEKINNVALIRIEQLYPFPVQQCIDALKQYAHVQEVIWCQEEPKNQGAWAAVQPYLLNILDEFSSNKKEITLSYAGRIATASSAAGYHSVHEKEQEQLVSDALTKRKHS